jgi:tRNA nucleotidyltransferase (CCA-adding enzyme)
MSLNKISALALKYELKHSLYVKADTSLDKSKVRPSALEACRILKENGFESYLVGGCVRDLLMGKSPKDWDVTSNATPDQVKTIFPRHFALGEKHGTITAILGPDKQDEIEITTYRTEGTYSDGRRPDEVRFADNVEDDLSRRDLTINALAYDPIDNKLIDPYGGQEDLAAKKIKAVGDPNERFAEDGLRTMRVARFAARFGFDVDPETETAITNHLGTLKMVSKERFTSELLATLVAAKPSVGLNILFKTGALAVGDPALANPAIESNFAIIDANSDASLEVKVAILLHKLAPAELANTLKNLKFPNDRAALVLFLISALQDFVKFHNNATPLAARKFFSFIKNQTAKYPILGGYDKCLAEFLALAKALGTPALQELSGLMHEKPLTMKDLDVSGNDLMTTLNMKPGPKLKKVLDSLYEEVLSNPELNEKSKLLELASKFEKMAVNSLKSVMFKRGAEDWWRLSDPEEKALLDREYDFGNGLKFKAKDIPELSSQIAVPAGPLVHHPEKNQLLHTQMVFDQAKKLSDDPMVWFAALLHDLGKSYTDKAIWPKQHGHELGGVPYVERVADMLGVPEQWKQFAKLVAEHHLKCHTAKELSPKTLRKLFESFNNDKALFNAYLTSCEADAKGRLGGHALKPYEQKAYLAQKMEEGFEEKKNPPSTLALSGNDLMQAFGLKPGPELGKVMKTIKEMVDANPTINDRQTLLDIAKNLLVK